MDESNAPHADFGSNGRPQATVALNHDAVTTAPLLVRGNNRAQGDLFGDVISALHVPLRTAWGEWIHVAGASK